MTDQSPRPAEATLRRLADVLFDTFAHALARGGQSPAIGAFTFREADRPPRVVVAPFGNQQQKMMAFTALGAMAVAEDMQGCVFASEVWSAPEPRGYAANFTLRGGDCFLLGDDEPDLRDVDALTRLHRAGTAASPHRRISDEVVQAVRRARADGASYKAIAMRHGIAASHVRRILTGEVHYARED